jgi:hypothetical protein
MKDNPKRSNANWQQQLSYKTIRTGENDSPLVLYCIFTVLFNLMGMYFHELERIIHSIT